MCRFERNKVFRADCFDLIKVVPDKSLDLVIVDPPYGDNVGYGRNGKEILNNEDESINYRFLEAIYPKMKDNTSLYIFSNHRFVFQIKQFAIDFGYKYRMLCIMVKNNIGMGYGFRNQYEVCLVLEKGTPKYYRNDVSNVWRMQHINHNHESHPHQKEYTIIRRIVLHSSKEGDLIFDGFMGSFATAVACQKEKRDFIGTELDRKWFDIGQKKLFAVQAQTTLF